MGEELLAFQQGIKNYQKIDTLGTSIISMGTNILNIDSTVSSLQGGTATLQSIDDKVSGLSTSSSGIQYMEAGLGTVNIGDICVLMQNPSGTGNSMVSSIRNLNTSAEYYYSYFPFGTSNISKDGWVQIPRDVNSNELIGMYGLRMYYSGNNPVPAQSSNSNNNIMFLNKNTFMFAYGRSNISYIRLGRITDSGISYGSAFVIKGNTFNRFAMFPQTCFLNLTPNPNGTSFSIRGHSINSSSGNSKGNGALIRIDTIADFNNLAFSYVHSQDNVDTFVIINRTYEYTSFRANSTYFAFIDPAAGTATILMGQSYINIGDINPPSVYIPNIIPLSIPGCNLTQNQNTTQDRSVIAYLGSGNNPISLYSFCHNSVGPTFYSNGSGSYAYPISSNKYAPFAIIPTDRDKVLLFTSGSGRLNITPNTNSLRIFSGTALSTSGSTAFVMNAGSSHYEMNMNMLQAIKVMPVGTGGFYMFWIDGTSRNIHLTVGTCTGEQLNSSISVNHYYNLFEFPRFGNIAVDSVNSKLGNKTISDLYNDTILFLGNFNCSHQDNRQIGFYEDYLISSTTSIVGTGASIIKLNLIPKYSYGTSVLDFIGVSDNITTTGSSCTIVDSDIISNNNYNFGTSNIGKYLFYNPIDCSVLWSTRNFAEGKNWNVCYKQLSNNTIQVLPKNTVYELNPNNVYYIKTIGLGSSGGTLYIGTSSGTSGLFSYWKTFTDFFPYEGWITDVYLSNNTLVKGQTTYLQVSNGIYSGTYLYGNGYLQVGTNLVNVYNNNNFLYQNYFDMTENANAIKTDTLNKPVFVKQGSYIRYRIMNLANQYGIGTSYETDAFGGGGSSGGTKFRIGFNFLLKKNMKI